MVGDPQSRRGIEEAPGECAEEAKDSSKQGNAEEDQRHAVGVKTGHQLPAKDVLPRHSGWQGHNNKDSETADGVKSSVELMSGIGNLMRDSAQKCPVGQAAAYSPGQTVTGRIEKEAQCTDQREVEVLSHLAALLAPSLTSVQARSHGQRKARHSSSAF